MHLTNKHDTFNPKQAYLFIHKKKDPKTQKKTLTYI